jgi:hypothetical protein
MKVGDLVTYEYTQLTPVRKNKTLIGVVMGFDEFTVPGAVLLYISGEEQWFGQSQVEVGVISEGR